MSSTKFIEKHIVTHDDFRFNNKKAGKRASYTGVLVTVPVEVNVPPK